MSSNSFFAPSPTVVLPPNKYFANHHYPSMPTNNTSIFNRVSPNSLANANPFMSNRTAIDPNPAPSAPLAGRKRSRHDSQDGDEEEQLEDGSMTTTGEAKKPRGQPVYGPGMTLLYPDDPAYDRCAESQSGTWVEEREARAPFGTASTQRPSVSSRKSQRMDSKAIGPDDLAQLVLPPQIREVTEEPLIDEATRRLGISWTRMDSSEARQINQKAYSKWIQNHYPALTDVAIWFENSSIPGYLVTALNAHSGIREYYIFCEDLTEARLVTNEPSQLIPRLQMLPALHLAAPGGHIRAETDPITAAQNEVNSVVLESTAFGTQPNGCAAHSMELD